MKPSATAFAGAAALAVAMGIGRFAFTPILPMMAGEGLSLEHGSWLATANYLGYLAGAFTAGRARRPAAAVRGALLAITLATAAMAWTGSLPAWLVLRFVAGVASALALVHVSSYCLARLARGPRPLLNGVLYAGVGFGIALAGLVCLALMDLRASAGEAWLGFGVISLAFTLALWRRFDCDGDLRPVAAASAPFQWTPEAMLLVACYGALGFGYILPATFVPAMAKTAIGDPRLFGWAWPAFGATAALSTLIAVQGTGKSWRALWRVSALVMALGVASPVMLRGLTGVLLAALLVGGTFMVITMAGLQEARRLAGSRAPALMAAMTAAFAAGQIAGPLVVPLLGGSGGVSAPLTLAALVLVASALLLPREKDESRSHAAAR
jgi:MFS family permease